jgi:lipopolysaccharide export LptBFGC system permease protein LptF
VKIITRSVLREHLGPLIFSLTALTSLLMLQFVARQLGNLVGKGLPWRVIAEFFVLSLPFTVAMTLPMAVLVATLHAFGRMATEHEITAYKASGVRVTTLMWPVTVGAAMLALGMVVFNDQVLPRANHRLRILQQDMARTKPTFALNEQTLNQITQGFYMRVGKLDRESNKMSDVTIYDMSAPFARKTIYADSGDLAVTPDKKDLQLMLYDGYQQEIEGDTKRGLRRSYFRTQAVRVKDVTGGFEQTANDDWKGDREKSVCEMQTEYVNFSREYERIRQMYIVTASRGVDKSQKITVPRPRPATGGLAKLYCNGLALVFRMPTAVPSDQPITAVSPSQLPPSVGMGSATSTGASGDPAAANATPGATPATPPVNAAPMTAAMQAELDKVKESLANTNTADNIAEQRATAARVVAQQQAEQAAQVAAQKARQDAANKELAAAAAAAAAESTKTAAARDSNAVASPPGTPPVNPPAGAVNPAVVAANPPGAVTVPTVTATPPVAVQPPAGNPPVPNPSVPNPAVNPPATSAPVAVTPAAQPIIGNAGVPISPTPSIVAAPAPPGAGDSATQPAPTTPATADPQANIGLITADQAELNATRQQLSMVRAGMDGLDVEIQKKFALSFACIVFVLFGPPIALRFPRGGVGATLGISLVVFGLYYVCLIAGETLADDGKLPPIIAMWMANVIFTIAGFLLLLRIEKTADASRGGGIRAWFEERRLRRTRPPVRVADPTVAV